ncbi:hypothetical protein L208DRAFT_1239737 [Tricholoma matsutake]|nr:hypothetical protein L208DRAFT_1239737 [Tricholoma matsutake 945]
MQNPDKEVPTRQSDDPAANAILTWCWAGASLLLLAASFLTLFPRLLLFVSETESISEHRRSALTPLESFLALHFGIWLGAIAIALILDASGIPLSSSEVSDNQRSSSYHPLLWPLSVAASVTAFLSYNTRNVGTLSWMAFVGSTIIGVWGFWTIVFGNSSLISKKTGADKRTSSFLFGNKTAASVQKKQWTNEQKAQKRKR